MKNMARHKIFSWLCCIALTSSIFSLFGCSIFGSSTGQSGTITTIAGTGNSGFSGDGGQATAASLSAPASAVTDSNGNLYIVDSGNNRIRKVTGGGVISTIAGSTSNVGFAGDGGPATAAVLSTPKGIAFDQNGNIFISDTGNHRIRKINQSGTISTIAGGGNGSSIGDGGAATSAILSSPVGICFDASGNLYIADQGSNRIRKVTPAGVISTYAGNGYAQFGGDGGQATGAGLNGPSGVVVDGSGNLYIADFGNNRIRKVSTTGVISTIAGTAVSGFSGDGGQAASANLAAPFSLVLDTNQDLVFSDYANDRIRKITPAGIISTIAGNGYASYGGDGGPATSASIWYPLGVAIDISGDLYIADGANERVRKVSH